VAYSLRAVLAVQQDALLESDSPLLPTDDECVAALQRLTDLYTLGALALADRAARDAGERELSAERLGAGWNRLAAASRLPDAGSEGATATAQTAEGSVGSQPVLHAIIAEKIAAYESYNRIDLKEAQRLLLTNIERFYARHRLPDTAEGSVAVQRAFQQGMMLQISRLLEASEAAARAAGEPLVRAPHVSAAAQQLFPHEVDDLEDVTFYPSLPRSRRFVLESYDMDSFRDFGLHWQLLRNTLGSGKTSSTLDLDPFAAEQIAEMTAQIGVLIFRIAGDVAREDVGRAHLLPEDVERALVALPRLAELDASANPDPSESRVASAPTGLASGSDAGRYLADVTEEVGLAFRHRTSDWLSRLRRTLSVTPPTFSGGGIGAEDINGDERLDLLLVGGMGNALLLNDGRGGFVDATEESGLSWRRPDGHAGEARQPLIADLDNDGRQDVVITYANDPHRVYRNLGRGRFEDVTARAGLGGEGLVGGAATVFDFDNDGLLDLYVGYFGNYLQGDVPERMPQLDREGGQLEEYSGDLPTLARDNTNALPNKLFRNLGNLRFEEVREPGLANTGWAQAVAHSDVNLDGLQDVVVANDFGRNAILLNRGGGRFENAAESLGMSKAYHSMNVGIGDLNQDSYPDLYISNLNTMLKDSRYVLPNESTVMDSRLQTLATMRVSEASVLYVSKADDGGLREYTISDAVERGATSVGWAWDADFFDFDNDGDDDLYVLNGANEYRLLEETWKWREREGDEARVLRLSHHDQPNIFYLNDGGRLRDHSQASGADFVGNSRSAVYLDYDEDGDLDVAVNNFQGDAVFLRNEAVGKGGNWLKVRLVGDPRRGSNRDAIGARLVATTPAGGRVWREVHGGSGYLSMEPKQQHFGLGSEGQARLEIVWPNGERQSVEGLLANRSYVIEQGRPEPTLAPSP
jgi:hypothetical protein